MALLRSRLTKGYVSLLVIAATSVLLLVSMFAPFVSTSIDFSIFNTGWNGTSGLAEATFKAGKFAPSFQLKDTGTDMEVVQVGLDEIDLDPVSAALVIVGPSIEFTAAEGALVAEFVQNGGVLLLADDFGTGNTLLEGMGAKSRVSEKLVIDLAFTKKPEFCVCFDVRPDPLTRNVTALLLNYPSSLDIDPGTTKAIAYTSVASWLDLNDDRMQEYGEPRGPFVTIARESFGAGTILLISDPSVLINGMQEYLNNSALGDNIVAEVCTGRTSVFFDESHRDYFDPIALAMEFTGSIGTNAKGVLVVATFVLALWLTTDYVERSFALAYRKIAGGAAWFSSKILGRKAKGPVAVLLTREDIERQLAEKHPEWRPGLIRYILKEAERHAKAIEEKERLSGEPRSG